MRGNYVSWLKQAMPSGTMMLVIANNFDQDSTVSVPPFPVSDKAFFSLFGDTFTIDILADERVEPKEKWKLRGVRNLREKAFLLKKM